MHFIIVPISLLEEMVLYGGRSWTALISWIIMPLESRDQSFPNASAINTMFEEFSTIISISLID